jgi:hypothetical protein
MVGELKFRKKLTRPQFEKFMTEHDPAVVVSGIITFGHEAQMMFDALSTARQDEAFRDLAQRVAHRLKTQVESLVSHGDETAPHAHFMLRGYTHEGLPVSKIATYKVTAGLQDITAEVMQTYCSDIERGHEKWERIQNGAACDFAFLNCTGAGNAVELHGTARDACNAAFRFRQLYST